jgi:hypothetical protein
MASGIPLTDDDVEWLKSYTADVKAVFAAEFHEAGNRFRQGQRLLDRFAEAVDAVLDNGRPYFRAVDEAHNELCIASAILSNPDPKISCLEYEPPLPGCAKSIDFKATAEDGVIYYVDVKTIKPESKDRWEQYERAVNEKWLPKDVNVILSKPWLGGELWHHMFTARARMLEYVIELESKIAEGRLAAENVFFSLALCGEGFYWREDELEDFVSFYYSGTHRADDPFSQAEQNYMGEKNISLKRTVSSFACMNRAQGTIRQRPINWRVQPPRTPFV